VSGMPPFTIRTEEPGHTAETWCICTHSSDVGPCFLYAVRKKPPGTEITVLDQGKEWARVVVAPFVAMEKAA
jgi:hypothetical protein